MQFCPDCGARITDKQYCNNCGLDLSRFFAPEAPQNTTRESEVAHRKRILADFEIVNQVVVRYLGKGGKVVIPEGIFGIRDSAFYRCEAIREVVLPNSVHRIGEKAFYGCTQLESITLPEDLEYIGTDAFKGSGLTGELMFPPKLKEICRSAFEACDYLERVFLPASLIKLGASAFASCKSLKAILVNRASKNFSAQGGVLFNKNANTLICYPSGKQDRNYSVPSSVNVIAESAFYENAFLEVLHIPSAVSNIQANALLCQPRMKKVTVSPFNRAYASDKGILYDKQKKVLFFLPPSHKSAFFEIPYGVTEIFDNAVVDSGTLEEVRIPSTVRRIGQNVFYSCKKLTTIRIGKENPYYRDVDGVLFDRSGKTLLRYPAGREKTYYEVPKGVVTIEKTAFAFSKYLSAVVLNDELAKIGDYAFTRCDALGYAYFPRYKVNFPDSAFPRECILTQK